MLRCLGVNFDTVSAVYGDNLGVIQNATIKDSLLKKKHDDISYHKVCGAVSAGNRCPDQGCICEQLRGLPHKIPPNYKPQSIDEWDFL